MPPLDLSPCLQIASPGWLELLTHVMHGLTAFGALREILGIGRRALSGLGLGERRLLEHLAAMEADEVLLVWTSLAKAHAHREFSGDTR
jgi:hypothetical protein